MNNYHVDYLHVESTTVHNLLEAVEHNYNDMENRVANMEQQLKDWNKATEIQKLKDEISTLRKYSLYTFNEVEYNRFQEFKKFHSTHCRSICVELEGVGIGTIVKMRCLGCGDVKDITDEGSW